LNGTATPKRIGNSLNLLILYRLVLVASNKRDIKTLFAILIIVQRDATQSSRFIILQVHSTCFGCQTHPSSGVHKTVTTASGTAPATSLQRDQAS
jgi:dolichyl-phosphate-mannose--protein O-mannosyl transferase